MNDSMNAVVSRRYGPPEVLTLTEVPKPIPAPDQVLVRVHAVSLNSWDWEILRGYPALTRLSGLTKPQYEILGADIAGRIESTGDHVSKLHVGDKVFGDISGYGWGGLAEYVCVPEGALAVMPESLAYTQAAAIPQAGVMALQSLRLGGDVTIGQRVLINGAGGGVGTFAVQIAKLRGAHVTAVDSKEKAAMLQSIGADTVIDYRQSDFANVGQRFDLIVDVMARHSVAAYRGAMNQGSRCVLIGGSTSRILSAVVTGKPSPRNGDKSVRLLIYKQSTSDLMHLAELAVAGDIKPIIDRCFPLAETASAMKRIAEGKSLGKVIISVVEEVSS